MENEIKNWRIYSETSTCKDIEAHNAFCDCREVEQERNGSYHCVKCCWTLPSPYDVKTDLPEKAR